MRQRQPIIFHFLFKNWLWAKEKLWTNKSLSIMEQHVQICLKKLEKNVCSELGNSILKASLLLLWKWRRNFWLLIKNYSKIFNIFDKKMNLISQRYPQCFTTSWNDVGIQNKALKIFIWSLCWKCETVWRTTKLYNFIISHNENLLFWSFLL